MSFLDYAKKLLNFTTTENGDRAYLSTDNACLDYFYAVGGKRSDRSGVLKLFVRAYLESPITALKLLLYTRNIKSGLGERDLFRYCLSALAEYEPESAKKIIPYVVEYGRYDDLLCMLYSPVEDEVLKIIKKQLDEDLENKKAGKPISLLAKWLPSINTSNWSVRKDARYLAFRLNMSYAEYRKTLSFLRKGLILENNLREKDYTFDYQGVPSAALNNYRDAFLRNDKERYTKYMDEVKQGKAKMNIGVLDVVNFIKRADKELKNQELRDYYETAWEQLVNESKFNSKTLVVRDGSGSMYSFVSGDWTRAIDVANAITLLAASRIKGEFADQFITFSASPEIVDMRKKKSLFDKLAYLRTFNDISNTNIEKVYQLIIDVYKRPDFKKEDAIDQIIIVSDMEFDCLSGRYMSDEANQSTFEYFKKEFSKIGHKMPEIVFWNVNSRGYHSPVEKDEQGVKLISGATKNILDFVINTDSIDPLDFMNKVLEQYAFIDKLFE